MYCIIDTETTGFPKGPKYKDSYKIVENFNNARIVQIAVAFYDEKYNPIIAINGIVKPEGFQINDQCKSTIIHGITQSKAMKEGRMFLEIMQEILNIMMKYEKIILIAHNMNFDFPIILSELHRRGQHPCIDYIQRFPRICTLKLSGNKKLKTWYNEIFAKEMIGAHDALYDVFATVECCLNLFKKHEVDYHKIYEASKTEVILISSFDKLKTEINLS